MKSGRALALRSLVTAFVYRRYLDYGVFEGLRQLHAKVRDEAQRRAAGRPQRANDVKLSRGGIREIEFIVQLLLVVRGGQFPEIRTRSTLKALDKLAAGGLMKRASAERLAAAYTLLRRVEHRIQYLDDQQTHVLPEHDGDLAWIAASLGAEASGPCALLDRLGEAREFVASEFDLLLHDGRAQHRQRLPQLRPGAAAGRCRDFPGAAAGRAGGAGAAALRPAEDPDAEGREQDAPRRPGGARRPGGGRRSAAPCRRRSGSSTGSSRCCAAKATSPCSSSAPRCRTGCCACSAWRAGRCAT